MDADRPRGYGAEYVGLGLKLSVRVDGVVYLCALYRYEGQCGGRCVMARGTASHGFWSTDKYQDKIQNI